MLGETRVDPQSGMGAEVVPNFERERDQRKHVDGYGKNAEGVEFVAADRRCMLARGVDDNTEANDQDGISGEAFIEQKLLRGQRKNQQPSGGNGEEEVAARAQESGHRTETARNQDGAFGSEGQRDPLALEADGNCQSGEGE